MIVRPPTSISFAPDNPEVRSETSRMRLPSTTTRKPSRAWPVSVSKTRAFENTVKVMWTAPEKTAEVYSAIVEVNAICDVDRSRPVTLGIGFTPYGVACTLPSDQRAKCNLFCAEILKVHEMTPGPTQSPLQDASLARLFA